MSLFVGIVSSKQDLRKDIIVNGVIHAIPWAVYYESRFTPCSKSGFFFW